MNSISPFVTTAFIKRFWSKVNKGEHCWIWRGAKSVNGYGKISVNKILRGAHRVSWVICGLEDSDYLVNTCDNKLCVNPEHWTPGTMADARRIHVRPPMVSLHRPREDDPDILEYWSWRNAKYRTCYPTSKNYHHYGGRGITMCQRWKESFYNFLSDLGKRPTKEHSIDRIDNNGGYWCGKCEECINNGQPANCRWATMREQSRNKRSNHWISVGAETLTITQWAERLGSTPTTLADRIRKGLTPEQAVTTPILKRNSP